MRKCGRSMLEVADYDTTVRLIRERGGESGTSSKRQQRQNNENILEIFRVYEEVKTLSVRLASDCVMRISVATCSFTLRLKMWEKVCPQ